MAHQSHLEALLEGIAGPTLEILIQSCLVRPENLFAFLTCSHLMLTLTLVVWGPHCQNNCPGFLCKPWLSQGSLQSSWQCEDGD